MGRPRKQGGVGVKALIGEITDVVGMCHCGCGEPAPLATRTDTRKGWVQGQPVRFLRQHHRRLKCGRTPSRWQDPRPRFFAKVERIPFHTCWEWNGKINAQGYGMLWVNGVEVRAHRVSWLLHYGDPGALVVCHRCDNPSCVNPDHLFLGTQADNVADMWRKGRASPPPNRWATRTEARQ